jgi:hypothetical protein
MTWLAARAALLLALCAAVAAQGTHFGERLGRSLESVPCVMSLFSVHTRKAAFEDAGLKGGLCQTQQLQ